MGRQQRRSVPNLLLIPYTVTSSTRYYNHDDSKCTGNNVMLGRSYPCHSLRARTQHLKLEQGQHRHLCTNKRLLPVLKVQASERASEGAAVLKVLSSVLAAQENSTLSCRSTTAEHSTCSKIRFSASLDGRGESVTATFGQSGQFTLPLSVRDSENHQASTTHSPVQVLLMIMMLHCSGSSASMGLCPSARLTFAMSGV